MKTNLRLTIDDLRLGTPGVLNRQSEEGFTLLEMVIAATLLAMIAVGLWAVFRISIQSWSRGTEFIDANQRNRSILDKIRKQIASTYGIFIPPDMNTGKPLSVIFSGDDTHLRFISLNSLQFLKSPGLTFVSYDVEQGSTGDYELVEREQRYVGDSPDLESVPDQVKPIKIFEGLVSCTFEYYDPGSQDVPPQWVKEWDGEDQPPKLPQAVSISLVSRDREGNNLTRHMVVPIQAKAYATRFNMAVPGVISPGMVNPGGRIVMQ